MYQKIIKKNLAGAEEQAIVIQRTLCAKADVVCVWFVFFTVPNMVNPEAPDSPEDNAIPESTPSPPDPGRIGPEIPGNTGEQTVCTEQIS